MNNNIPFQSFTEMKKKGELIAPKKFFLLPINNTKKAAQLRNI